jgi:hypothetical protein
LQEGDQFRVVIHNLYGAGKSHGFEGKQRTSYNFTP